MMEEILIKDKQKYLNDSPLYKVAPKLTDKKKCLHCCNIISVGDYKVFRNTSGDEFICCPNAPECNGSAIDWFEIDEKI